MGVFELENFAHGTRGVCETIANVNGATTIIGGGDSAAATCETVMPTTTRTPQQLAAIGAAQEAAEQLAEIEAINAELPFTATAPQLSALGVEPAA